MKVQELNGLRLGVLLLVHDPSKGESWGTLEGVAHWDGEHLAIQGDSKQQLFDVPFWAWKQIRPVEHGWRDVFPTSESFVAVHVQPGSPPTQWS